MATPGGAQDHSKFEGEVLGIVEGHLLAYVWDTSLPDRAVEVEVLGGQGFYARAIADQHLANPSTFDLPGRACGISLPVPDEGSAAGDAALEVIAGSTWQTLPHKDGPGAATISGIARWRLLVHRLHWELTGQPAAAERLEEEAALLQADPAAATGELVRRLSAVRAAMSQAAPSGTDEGISTSPEALVAEAYRGVLARDPEEHGVGIFASSLRSGAPVAEVIKALIGSEEFQSRWEGEHPHVPPPPDPDIVSFRVQDLVSASYRSVLRREPEGEAYNIFVPVLRAGADPSVLIDALISSDEYQAMVKREHAPSEPSPGAFTFTAAELVEFGYRIALKRDPEPAGYEIYGSALQNGMPFQAFVGELLTMPESLAAWGVMRAADLSGQAMVGAELTRLSASIERSLLTLAMGAALGTAGPSASPPPDVPAMQVAAKEDDTASKASPMRGQGRRGKGA